MLRKRRVRNDTKDFISWNECGRWWVDCRHRCCSNPLINGQFWVVLFKHSSWASMIFDFKIFSHNLLRTFSSNEYPLLSLALVESDTKYINKNQHKSSWLAFKKDLSVVAWGSRARWEKIVYNLSSIIQSSARNCITTSVHFATHGYVTNTRHSVVSITLLNTVQDVVTFVNEQRRQPARNCRLFTKFANKSFRAACKKSQCV